LVFWGQKKFRRTFPVQQNKGAMRILIIEDEQPAAKRLGQLIRKLRPEAEIVDALDSVSAAVRWFGANEHPELALMDIQLADGLSFDIFTQIQVNSMVIFTTAYDQYALRAFKVNSVDYLLKPIESGELDKALHKFEQYRGQNLAPDRQIMAQLLQSLQAPSYKERFIVKSGAALTYVHTADLRWCQVEDGLVFLHTQDGKRRLVDYTLEQLEQFLDPRLFFRINRQMLVHIESVIRMHPYFNNRLKLDLFPAYEGEVIVSRDKVHDFKRWVEGG
jgi:DNA-binding LytR/AlgR family response regulator